MVRPVDETSAETDSLVNLLRHRASEDPTAEFFSFLPDGEAAGAIVLSRGELDRRARALASRLHDRGLAGHRALLLYPPGLEFIVAFFGCLYRGSSRCPPTCRGPTARWTGCGRSSWTHGLPSS